MVIDRIGAGHMPGRPVDDLLAMSTPIAPAFCAFFTLAGEVQVPSIDQRDIARERCRIGNRSAAIVRVSAAACVVVNHEHDVAGHARSGQGRAKLAAPAPDIRQWLPAN